MTGDTMPSPVTARYAPRQQFLHWLTLVLMFSILPVAWVLVSVVEESKAFFLWLDVHESLGISLLALTLLRLALRVSDRAPTPDHRAPRWTRVLANIVHWGLFAMLILMPVSGYIWSTGHGHDVAPFNVIRFPRVVFGHRDIGDIAERVHLFCEWVLYGLIGLHVTGVCYHVFVVRDGLLSRMLPPQMPPQMPEKD